MSRIGVQFPLHDSRKWYNGGNQSFSSGHRLDIPMRTVVPDARDTNTVIPEMGESQDESEPPDEMKLVSDIWAVGIPHFDCMLADQSENLPFDKPIQY